MATGSKFGKLGALLGKGWVITLLVIALLLIAIRIALPPVLLKVANNYLSSEMPGYTGHLDDIDLALIRGAYQAEGFYLDKIDSATGLTTDRKSVV